MEKIRIFNEEDRLKVAAVLVKNGYKVWQGKEQKGTSKSFDYLILFDDIRGEK